MAVCRNGSAVEIGSGESYGDAERAVKRFAKCGRCDSIAYFRIEERVYRDERL